MSAKRPRRANLRHDHDPWRYAERHEPSMWLRGRLGDIADTIAAGRMRACGHPSSALVALWEPDRVVCDGCRARLSLTGPPDHTCDRCGAVVARVWAMAAHLDPPNLLVLFGLCPSCRDREVAP